MTNNFTFDHDVDVLIAGGGPCGLMLANELGRRRVTCLLVDPKPGTAFNPQANATQARTMEYFRRLGFADEIRAQGLPKDYPPDIVYVTRFSGIELARLRMPTPKEAPALIKSLDGSWSAAELPHRVSQKFVEVVLHRHARGLESVDIKNGWLLTSFNDDGEQVLAEIESVDSEMRPIRDTVQTVRAKFLVAADGARSFVRKELGFRWEGKTGFKRKFMGGKMLAVYLKAPDFYKHNPNDRAWMYVAVNRELRAFIMSVDGVSEFAFHVQLDRDIEEDDGTPTISEDSAKLLFARAFGMDIEIEIISMAYWTAGHALVAESFSNDGRVFLGGDAVHLFTPTGGLGYNTAVEDAVNLGWKLAAVVQGQAPLQLLKTYELERKPLAIRNTTYSRMFADSIGLFEAHSELEDSTVAGGEARSIASEYLNDHVRREFNIPGVTFGGRYDDSPIIVNDIDDKKEECLEDLDKTSELIPPDKPNQYVPTSIPGGRPPHAWLEDESSLFDAFSLDWTLLVLGPHAPSEAAFVHAAKKLGLNLKIVRQVSEKLLELYVKPLVLVRPDMVVCWRGKLGNAAIKIFEQALGSNVGKQ